MARACSVRSGIDLDENQPWRADHPPRSLSSTRRMSRNGKRKPSTAMVTPKKKKKKKEEGDDEYEYVDEDDGDEEYEYEDEEEEEEEEEEEAPKLSMAELRAKIAKLPLRMGTQHRTRNR